MELKNKNAGGLQTLNLIMWVLAVVSGTLLGVAGSLALAVDNMWDAKMVEAMKAEEALGSDYLDWLTESKWLVTFTGENGRADLMSWLLVVIIVLGILFMVSAIVLCIQTGTLNRNPDGSIQLSRFDCFWSEAILAAGCAAGVCAVALAMPLYEIWPSISLKNLYTASHPSAYELGPSNTVTMTICISGMAICILLTGLCAVSLIKKIKAHCFWEKSFFGGIVLRIYRSITASDETMFKVMGLLICGMLLSMTWIGAAAVLAVILLCVPKIVRQFTEIRCGVSEVKSGNLTYRIPVETDRRGNRGELARLAEDINEISQASNLAVQNELKNQRMKTELISNVSHDLKTPLTSMVSYIDLLEKEGLDSPNAPEYLRILDEKTQRLKVLTENLFEAAKASSGDMPVHMDVIDLGSLISQSLGEMEERLSAQNLDLIVENHCAEAEARGTQNSTLENVCKNVCSEGADNEDTAAEVQSAGPHVMADGQLLWRVIENLLGNVSKYALPGSRVYIDISSVKQKDGCTANSFVLLEIKNISRDRLNISADELTERFKRGDASRNTEGSGLGLAIARDLTRLMDGVFELNIDGDLFKASVLLNQA